jgi:hypothetical protein
MAISFQELKPLYDLVCIVGYGVDDRQSIYREDVADGITVIENPINGNSASFIIPMHFGPSQESSRLFEATRRSRICSNVSVSISPRA